MGQQKKKWVRPLLTVLARGHRQETVLECCKVGQHPNNGPGNAFQQCYWLAACNGPCRFCDIGTS